MGTKGRALSATARHVHARRAPWSRAHVYPASAPGPKRVHARLPQAHEGLRMALTGPAGAMQGLYFVVIFATMLLAVAAPLAYLTDPAHPDPLWRDKVSQSVRTRHAKDFTLP